MPEPAPERTEKATNSFDQDLEVPSARKLKEEPTILSARKTDVALCSRLAGSFQKLYAEAPDEMVFTNAKEPFPFKLRAHDICFVIGRDIDSPLGFAWAEETAGGLLINFLETFQHRQGYGTALLGAIKEAGYQAIEVSASRYAPEVIAFYSANGFQRVDSESTGPVNLIWKEK